MARLDVVVYRWPGSRRSCFVADALFKGIGSYGESVSLRDARSYSEPEADVAVWYGYSKPIMEGYRRAGKKAIYVDLGYWAREGFTGHHKLAINSRHPTSYFQRRRHSPDRFRKLPVTVKPWTKSGDFVIVAGMSAKGAAAEGLNAEEWERRAVAELRKHTSRRIVYRPKPNWHSATRIEGTDFQKGHSQGDDVPDVLRNCHAVVTHHSNVAVDALLAGVPVFCLEGIASVLGKSNLSEIESPIRPEGREQWAYDAAWTQWSVPEMASGAAWRHLREEGLV